MEEVYAAFNNLPVSGTGRAGRQFPFRRLSDMHYKQTGEWIFLSVRNEQFMDEEQLHHIRTTLQAQGFTLCIKNVWGKKYAYGVAQENIIGCIKGDKIYLAPLDNLEKVLHAALTLSTPKWSPPVDQFYFRNDGNAKPGTWKRALRKLFSGACMRCGWDLAPCDTHHIVPKRKGGKQTLENGVILCPNCHRLADYGILSIEELRRVRENAEASALRNTTS